ncbi:MAG TPA: YegP family protein [Phycisphaerales bacterium]
MKIELAPRASIGYTTCGGVSELEQEAARDPLPGARGSGSMRFRVCKTPRGNFWFELSERNHGLLITGEPVASEAAAIEEIEWVRAHADDDQIFQLTVPSEGGFAFLLRGPSGGILGRSRPYADRSERDNAITMIRARAGTAPLSPSDV